MIILVRHGKSEYSASYRRASLRDMKRLLVEYDLAGIAQDSYPSNAVVARASEVDLIVCSDLPRSIASAAKLAGEKQVVIDAIFREPELPVPRFGWRLTAPPALWVGILRTLWLFRLVTGEVESPRAVWSRAQSAASTLICLSRERGVVMLVGHSLFNFLVGYILVRQGWSGSACFQGHWDSNTYIHGQEEGSSAISRRRQKVR